MENQAERDDMLEELIDRFGEPPKSVLNLLEITNLRSMAHKLYMKEIQGRPYRITFTMYERARIHPARIPDLIERMNGAMSFKKTEPPQFIYLIKNNRQKASGTLLEITAKLLEEMRILLEE